MRSLARVLPVLCVAISLLPGSLDAAPPASNTARQDPARHAARPDFAPRTARQDPPGQVPLRRGGLAGQVVDADSRRPLEGVTVSVVSTGMSATTGPDGRFRFQGLEVGVYVIDCRIEGLRPLAIPDVIVKSGAVTEVAVTMALVPVADERVTVTGSFFPPPLAASPAAVALSSEEIRRAPGSAGDISRVLFGMPSVAKVTDQANILAVRGGSAYENLFLLDNIVVPNINHYPSFGSTTGNMSLLFADYVRDVTFHAGGFGVQFGGRVSSVMDIAYREGRRGGVSGQLTMDMTGAGVAAEGPLPGGAGSWMLAARRSYFDLIVQQADTGAMPQLSDVQGKVVVDAGRSGKLTLLGLAGFDESGLRREDVEESGESHYGPVTSREFTVGANWFQGWGARAYSNLSASWSAMSGHADFKRTATQQDAYRDDSSEDSFRVRLHTHHQAATGRGLDWGGELVRQRADLDYWLAPFIDPFGTPNPGRRRQAQVVNWDVAAFAQAEWPVATAFRISAGLRAERASALGRLEWSPRGAVAWQASPSSTLTASAGLYRQTWPLMHLAEPTGNRRARRVEAVHQALEFQHAVSASTRLSLSAFWKRYSGLPVDPAQPEMSVFDDLFNPTLSLHDRLDASGRARAYGVEATLQKKLRERLYGILGLSGSRAQYRDGLGTWRSRLYDNRFSATLEGGYRLSRSWEFSGRFIVAGGRPYTPIDPAASREANSEIDDWSATNSRRLPPYHSLNVRIDRRLFFKGSTLTLYVSAWNVYDNENVTAYYWDEIHRRPEPQRQWGLLPIFGVQYEF